VSRTAQKIQGREDPAKAKIWIDLDNSPHVPFFAPIIEELQKREPFLPSLRYFGDWLDGSLV